MPRPVRPETGDVASKVFHESPDSVESLSAFYGSVALIFFGQRDILYVDLLVVRGTTYCGQFLKFLANATEPE